MRRRSRLGPFASADEPREPRSVPDRHHDVPAFWKADLVAALCVVIYIVAMFGVVHVWNYISSTVDAFAGN